jgi:hypothetical protein
MELFALLAEPVRRRIIEILATGEHSAGHVADVIFTEGRIGCTGSIPTLSTLSTAPSTVCTSSGTHVMAGRTSRIRSRPGLSPGVAAAGEAVAVVGAPVIRSSGHRRDHRGQRSVAMDR